MDEHDRDNLNFLLNASVSVLSDWYEQASTDDITYALELLAAMSEENVQRMAELGIVVEEGDNMDVTDAVNVLDRFRLKHTNK